MDTPLLVLESGVGRSCGGNVADRHRVDADPDPYFHVDVDPDLDPDWHKNDADPHADPTTRKTKIKFFTFNHSIANLQCFTFLINVKTVKYRMS